MYPNRGGSRILETGVQNLRAKLESRERSAREMRAKSESRTKPKKRRGRGLGRELGEPFPRKFLKIQFDSGAIWYIFGASFNHLNPKSQDEIFDHLKRYYRSLDLIESESSLMKRNLLLCNY